MGDRGRGHRKQTKSNVVDGGAFASTLRLDLLGLVLSSGVASELMAMKDRMERGERGEGRTIGGGASTRGGEGRQE